MRSILLALAILAPAGAAPAELEGCRPVEQTIRLLRPLADAPWSDVSREGLSRRWPGQLQLVDCEPRDDECGRFETCHCDRLQYLGRTIDGQPQCADTFFFEIRPATGGRFTDRLDSVALVLSSTSRKHLESDVARLQRSIACPEPGGSESCLVDVKVARNGAVWSAWIHWMRDPLDATPLP